MSYKSGCLFVFSAPSGAGKTTLVKALTQAIPNTVVSISYTTRPPRPGERDGVDYFFVDQTLFQKMILEDAFLEYAEVFDHYYGTGRQWVEQQINRGMHVILEIDWQGARQVRQQWPQVSTVFILPPSLEILQERLQKRSQDTETVIQRRLAGAQAEIAHYVHFDYLVVNDDLSVALQELTAILVAAPLSRAHQSARYTLLLEALLKRS